jgi:hypothetical protein
MNANEISQRANSRLTRIRIISRSLKVLLVLYLIGVVWWDLPWEGFLKWLPHGTFASFSDTPLLSLVEFGLMVGLVVALTITCWQLLSLYQTGSIFAARNVQLLGRIGRLALAFGLVMALVPAINLAWSEWWETFSYCTEFWRFCLLVLLELIKMPWIIGGVMVIMISRIMDEGRKIQEEQELTV